MVTTVAIVFGLFFMAMSAKAIVAERAVTVLRQRLAAVSDRAELQRAAMDDLVVERDRETKARWAAEERAARAEHKLATVERIVSESTK